MSELSQEQPGATHSNPEEHLATSVKPADELAAIEELFNQLESCQQAFAQELEQAEKSCAEQAARINALEAQLKTLTDQRDSTIAGLHRLRHLARATGHASSCDPNLVSMQSGFFISSVPKSGTHLLATLVRIATGEDVVSIKEKEELPGIDFSRYESFVNLTGHYRIKHVKSNESLRKLFESRRCVVLIRDPRDLCNSMLHYIEGSTNKGHKKVAARLGGLSYEERIVQLAEGVKDCDGISISPGLHAWSCGFLELLEEFPESTLIRYEDFFVDDAIKPIVQRLFQVSPSCAHDLVARALRSGSKTKRVTGGGGRPCQWNQAFSAELKHYFASNYAELIDYLGYRV